MKVESEITVWSLFDDMRSIRLADDRKFLNLHGRYFSLNPILNGVWEHPILDGGGKKAPVLTLPFSV